MSHGQQVIEKEAVLAEGKTKPQSPKQVMDQLQVRLREGALIALVALCLYLCLALFSFDPRDPGWSYTGVDSEVSNLMGRLGAWIADVLFFLFGYLACIFPMMLGYQAWLVFRERGREFDFNWPMFALRALGLLLTLAAGAGIASLHFYRAGANLRQGSGGVLGSELAGWLEPASGYMGATLVLLACFLFGLTAFIDISWIKVMDRVGRWTLTLADRGQVAWVRWRNRSQEQARAREVTDQRHEALAREVEKKLHREPVKILALSPKPPEVSAMVAREKQGNLFKVDAVDGLPALHLLDASVPDASRCRSADDLEAMSRLLELKLLDYGVEALVEAVFPGPVITRFEIKPSPGVKVSKISGLVKDLARSLAVISVRVVEVIPGKSVIGIEIPTVDREIVKLSQVLSSNAYDNAQSPLSLALGHDIAGEPVVVDLARMPPPVSCRHHRLRQVCGH